MDGSAGDLTLASDGSIPFAPGRDSGQRSPLSSSEPGPPDQVPGPPASPRPHPRASVPRMLDVSDDVRTRSATKKPTAASPEEKRPGVTTARPAAPGRFRKQERPARSCSRSETAVLAFAHREPACPRRSSRSPRNNSRAPSAHRRRGRPVGADPAGRSSVSPADPLIIGDLASGAGPRTRPAHRPPDRPTSLRRLPSLLIEQGFMP